MKSPMQELIDNYYKLETINEFISWFSVNENRLLEEEKEQIIDAFVECWKENIPDGYECKLSAEEYYNKTYNQNK